MKAKEITSQIRKTLKEKSVSDLKEMLILLEDNFNEGSDLVYILILSELELRMPTVEFVKFLDSIN